MVGGAAYYGGKRMAEGQQRESEQEQRLEALEAQQAPAPAYAAPPAPAAQDDTIASLERLKGLLDQGVLTQDEFTAAKQKVLAGG